MTGSTGEGFSALEIQRLRILTARALVAIADRSQSHVADHIRRLAAEPVPGPDSEPAIGRNTAHSKSFEVFGLELRAARRAHGVSLRQAEQLSVYSRGMLSQAETGRALPGRKLVSWYENQFGGDGRIIAHYENALNDLMDLPT